MIIQTYRSTYLVHHGILGQKWGQRNGPPYPLKGGDYTEREKKAIYKVRKVNKNSIYNKKHFDKVLDKGSTISTLSYDKNRTKGVDMFYATYTNKDKHLYNALFNKPIKDADGNTMLKYKITNKFVKDVKIASEDSAAKIFGNLYKNDRDFYNFVTDENRMQKEFVKSKYKYKGYRDARKALEKLRADEKMTADDVQKIYRMFNYVIPSDGSGDARRAKDVSTQRDKFFNQLKQAGYSAVLDTNDAIYGSFKADAPIIVFDMESIIPDKVKKTTQASKYASTLITAGRKALGI